MYAIHDIKSAGGTTEMSSLLSHDRHEDQAIVQRGQSVHCMRYTMVLTTTLTLGIQPHSHG